MKTERKFTIEPSRSIHAEEVAEILGVSVSSAYRIIKRLNNSLNDQDKITVAGKISRRYFEEKVML